MLRRWTLLLFLFLGACSPAITIDTAETFAPPATSEPILVMPVVSIMCPDDVSQTFFDHLIDSLNGRGAAHGFSFVILKQDPATLPPETLAKRSYATGEIFGCLEDSGCCSGDFMMTVRLELFQPGHDEPTVKMRYPVDRFFDLEGTTPLQARKALAAETAEKVATDLIDTLQKGN